MIQKSLLMIAFTFSFFATAHAQITKGGIWLGGSIAYNEQKTEFSGSTMDYKNRTVGISPAIGKVVKDNLVVGIALNYYNNKMDNNSSSQTIHSKGNSYGGGVFIRQYVPVINRLYIFGQGNAGFSTTKVNQTDRDYNGYTTKYKTTGWSSALSITPGIAISITKNLQLESGFNNLFSVSYSKDKKRTETPNVSTTKNSLFSAGLSLENQSAFYLGFRWLINAKG